MKIHLCEIYSEPGVRFKLADSVYRALWDALSECFAEVSIPALAKRYKGADFTLGFVISSKSSTSQVAIKGPTYFKRTVDFVVDIPYRKLVGDAEAIYVLDAMAEGVGAFMRRYELSPSGLIEAIGRLKNNLGKPAAPTVSTSESRLEFQAAAFSLTDEDGTCMAAFADHADSPQRYVILQRAKQSDDQDRSLGFDRYNVEVGGQERSGHGGLREAILYKDGLVLRFHVPATRFGGLESVVIRIPMKSAERKAIAAQLRCIFADSDCSFVEHANGSLAKKN